MFSLSYCSECFCHTLLLALVRSIWTYITYTNHVYWLFSFRVQPSPPSFWVLPETFSASSFHPHPPLGVTVLRGEGSEGTLLTSWSRPTAHQHSLGHGKNEQVRVLIVVNGMCLYMFSYVLIQDLPGYYENKRWKRCPRKCFCLSFHYLWGECSAFSTGEMHSEAVLLVQNETSITSSTEECCRSTSVWTLCLRIQNGQGSVSATQCSSSSSCPTAWYILASLSMHIA